MLVGDDQRLAQVIANLLANSVKFTPDHGAIRFTASLQSQDAESCHLLITVSDTGIGISDEQRERLFTAFEQADAHTTRKYGGTGLGLTICKSIVEMMDGEIWMDSELGKGTTLSFTVRLARCDLEPGVPNMENIRVLAVSGDEDVLCLFQTLADKTGFTLHTVESGSQALSHLATNGPYQVCFVGIDGPGAHMLELVRDMMRLDAGTAVVVMASTVQWMTIEQPALAAGVHTFLPMPLFYSTLMDTIIHCAGVKAEDCTPLAPGLANEAHHHFGGHTLLVVEDIEVNREIVATLLEDTGISIDCAENGALAVSMFRDNPDLYSLILMDIQMPEMDGYEATEAIRSMGFAKAAQIPIVAMTANVFREDIDRCIAVGMNDHIGKPMSPGMLFEVLHKYLD